MKYRAKTFRLGRLRLSIALWAANPHRLEGGSVTTSVMQHLAVNSAHIVDRVPGPK